jgi:hypothetical protein
MEREIEKATRLSQSVLWNLQKNAYSDFGPRAWSGKGVPFYITSNPFIATQYVQVVIGYIRDCLSPVAATPIDPSKPLYFVDLGSGTGRFSYLFLKGLLEAIKELPFPKLDIRYVMTDVAVDNVQSWKNHRLFQPYVAEGVLDFAYYFHGETKKPLFLLESGTVLDQKTLVNPLIVISNYFFDTIPQDLFRVKQGEIYEGRVQLVLPINEETEKLKIDDPAVIPHMKNVNIYHEIKNLANYYPDEPILNDILREYTHHFKENSFLFPSGAFEVIRYFSKMSHGKMLLIAGDQGWCTKEQLQFFSETFIARHGTFSMSVNYHAISRYFEKKGGTSLIVDYPNIKFVSSAFILGGTQARYPETKYAFKNHFNHFDPENLLNLTNAVDQNKPKNIETALLLSKLGYWDPYIFKTFFETIREDGKSLNFETKETLIKSIGTIWSNFFPVNQEEAAFILNLGVIFADLKMYPEAIQYFERALEWDPQYDLALNNIRVVKELINHEHSVKT